MGDYGFIGGYDFGEMDAMKYFAPPSSWSEIKKKETARNRIFSGDWLGSQKMDGYFSKLVKDDDGNILLYSRSRGVSGEYPNKADWVPHLKSFFDALPCGTCLLGELYLPSAPGSKNITTILGCLVDKAVARQEKGEKLRFYAFDCLAYGGTNFIEVGAAQRFAQLANVPVGEYVSVAHYYRGNELWMMLQDVLANGGEGMVITHEDAHYEPGKRPSKTTLKIKKELRETIDCFFTGRTAAPTHEYTGKELESWTYWENVKTGEKFNDTLYKDYAVGAPLIPITKPYYFGWAGSLEIGVLRQKEGGRIKINGVIYDNTEIYSLGWLSGLTEEIKANPTQYAFKPFEISAMEQDKTSMALRHGKFVGWRNDLAITDCTYEKMVGEQN